jgi:large subunit ribosomal protein L18
MDKCKELRRQRKRKMAGLRRNLRGSGQKPRLSVFRSNRFIYAQAIDDLDGKTLACSDSRTAAAVKSEDSPAGKSAKAYAVGLDIAKKLTALGIERVVFDRGWYRYQGRVKALADAARKAGLKF